MFPGGATRSCAGTAPRGCCGAPTWPCTHPGGALTHTHIASFPGCTFLSRAASAPPVPGGGGRSASSPRAVPEEPALLFLPHPGSGCAVVASAPALCSAPCCGSPTRWVLLFGESKPPRHPARLLPAVKQPGAPHLTALQIQGGIPGIPASLFHLSARGRTDQLGREKFLLRVVLGAGRCFLLFLSSGGSRRLLARHRSHGGIEQVYSKPRSGRAGSMQVRWVYFRLSLLVSVVSFSFRLIPLWALPFSSGLCWFGFKKRCRALICGETEPGCPRRLPLIRTFQLFWFQYPQLDASAGISIVLGCFFITTVKK